MKSGVFVLVLINLHDQRRKTYLKWKDKNDWLGKLDQDCRNISETVKHCLDIQVKLLNLFDVVRKQDNFQPMN